MEPRVAVNPLMMPRPSPVTLPNTPTMPSVATSVAPPRTRLTRLSTDPLARAYRTAPPLLPPP